jgi:hypothetical protein
VLNPKGQFLGCVSIVFSEPCVPFDWEDNENDELQTAYKSVVVACFKVCASMQLHALRKITKYLRQGSRYPGQEPNSVSPIMKQEC